MRSDSVSIFSPFGSCKYRLMGTCSLLLMIIARWSLPALHCFSSLLFKTSCDPKYNSLTSEGFINRASFMTIKSKCLRKRKLMQEVFLHLPGNEYNHPAKSTSPGLIPKDPVDYISLDRLMN